MGISSDVASVVQYLRALKSALVLSRVRSLAGTHRDAGRGTLTNCYRLSVLQELLGDFQTPVSLHETRQ
jgi:hypothetical protein